MKEWLTSLARRYLPVSVRRRIAYYMSWPPVGLIRFGSLRRLQPINANWGTDRGRPIDRYYVEAFLARYAADIRGRVLEIGDNTYTREFGKEQVTESVVLHVAEQNEHVTLIGSLTDESTLPAQYFDCLIITQTLQTIYDVPAAIRSMYHSLKPGGVALITIPGISKISRYDMDRWGYYWSFTTKSAQKLFSEVFPSSNVHIEAHGNVLAAISFLHGLAAKELRRAELDYFDPDYELLITIRAVKPVVI